MHRFKLTSRLLTTILHPLSPKPTHLTTILHPLSPKPHLPTTQPLRLPRLLAVNFSEKPASNSKNEDVNEDANENVNEDVIRSKTILNNYRESLQRDIELRQEFEKGFTDVKYPKNPKNPKNPKHPLTELKEECPALWIKEEHELYVANFLRIHKNLDLKCYTSKHSPVFKDGICSEITWEGSRFFGLKLIVTTEAEFNSICETLKKKNVNEDVTRSKTILNNYRESLQRDIELRQEFEEGFTDVKCDKNFLTELKKECPVLWIRDAEALYVANFLRIHEKLDLQCYTSRDSRVYEGLSSKITSKRSRFVGLRVIVTTEAEFNSICRKLKGDKQV